MGYIFEKRSSCKKHEVIEQLYSNYSKIMYHVAYQILNDQFLAEDAVQNAFMKLEKNKFKIDSITCNKTKSFMVIITRNIAIEIYNKKKKEAPTYDSRELDEIPDNKLVPIDIIINNESISEIRDALSLLDSKYSDIILLKYFSDYSNIEIASLLNISEDLVRVRLHRAKKLLLLKVNGRKNVHE